MDPSIQAGSDYYVWELPGKSVAVHLHLSVVDRLSAEVMRGFGLIPKRGAEIGGVLLGTVEEGPITIVRVEDFEPVTCNYKRGASFLLSADDGVAFDETCSRTKPQSVGYFRSHTRDGFSLTPEDIVLLDRYFPSQFDVALLIKPFTTKVNVGSFFFREDGAFQSAAPLEFPFRRRELTGQEAPPHRTMMERLPRNSEVRVVPPPEEEIADTVPVASVFPIPPKSRVRSGWVWIPMSFVFLLLGLVLGFQAALTMGPRSGGGPSDFSLGLTVTREGNNLSVKWDRDAPAVKAAQKGVLEIEDGAYKKPVDLDVAQLRNGSILFTNTSPTVKFRMTVYPDPRVTVMQMMEWKAPAGK
jgi:hypothetical protein